MGFAEDLKKYCEKTKASMESVTRKTALNLLTAIEARSPVADHLGGRFRANWNCGIGHIDTTKTNSTDETGELVIARATAALNGWTPGEPIYLSNSLPQTLVIEYGLYGKPPGSANGPKTIGGYSSQAQGGVMRLSLQDLQQYLSRAIRGED